MSDRECQMYTPYMGRGRLNSTQNYFSVKDFRSLLITKSDLSHYAFYLDSIFTSNPIYADNNVETGGDRPVPAPTVLLRQR
jgi:hypothetical protein